MNLLRHILPLLLGVGLLRAADPIPGAPPGMVHIAAGEYKPLYAKGAGLRKVPACFLGIAPVTNGEYLAFVTAHPEWQRSKVTRSMADTNYLRHWGGDLDLGPDAGKMMHAPLTNVSWFAARAYCESMGRRLPSQDEWEFAARADATRIDATADQAFLRKLLDWYGKPAVGILPPVETAEANVHGLRGLHGLIWEWVHDFNSTMIVGDSRGDDSLERKLFCGAASLLASDVTNYAAYMRYAFRSSLKGTYCVSSLGFRTAASTGQEATPAALAGTPYELRGKWRTQDGREVALDSLRGKVRIVTMGFTSCPYSCPRIVGDMQRIETALGALADQTGFVFLSIDPARDTPAGLAEFAKTRKLSARWALLSGEETSVRDLAVTLNFKYQQVGKDFAHANLIAVLDAKGNVVHRQEELDADITPVVNAVKKLLSAP
jgi:sulfatase modifying factor 1